MMEPPFRPEFGREKAASAIDDPFVMGMQSGLIQDGPDRQRIGGMGGDDRDRCLGGEAVPS
jgi:hypothetical protein